MIKQRLKRAIIAVRNAQVKHNGFDEKILLAKFTNSGSRGGGTKKPWAIDPDMAGHGYTVTTSEAEALKRNRGVVHAC